MNGIKHWPLHASRQWIDPTTVVRLNTITKKTGAVLVITSTWRRFWNVELILKEAGVKAAVVGETPFLPSLPRGCEIIEWLSQHPDVKKYVILDDDSDMGDVLGALVQTQWEEGLQDKHVIEAIVKLS
jgi:hypothetical protein